MNSLMVCRSVFRFGNNVQSLRGWINYRSTDNSDIRRQVAATCITATHPGFTGAEQAYRTAPEICARGAVRVERVDGVMLRHHVEDVIRAASNREICHPEWLGIDGGIHAARKELAEGSGRNRRCL